MHTVNVKDQRFNKDMDLRDMGFGPVSVQFSEGSLRSGFGLVSVMKMLGLRLNPVDRECSNSESTVGHLWVICCHHDSLNSEKQPGVQQRLCETGCMQGICKPSRHSQQH
jgi:hypothetical protein